MSTRRVCSAALAFVTWFAVGGQLYLALRHFQPTLMGAAQALGAFANFFTNLTSLLVAAAMTAQAWSPRKPHLFARAGSAAALAAYLIVMSVVYVGMLRDLWDPTGLQLLVEVLMHYVIPPLYLTYWLAFVSKGRLRWRHALTWLLYPTAYGIFVVVHGAWTTHYPYPFLDAATIGYPRVLLNAFLLAILFLGSGLSVIALDAILGRHTKMAATPNPACIPTRDEGQRAASSGGSNKQAT